MTIRNPACAAGRKRLASKNRARKKNPSAILQPDFGTWFRATEPRRICYAVRDDANQWHDLAYLSSYLHDARFCPSQTKLVKGCLRIRLERDCWELFGTYGEVISVPSVLEISPVLNLHWRLEHAVLEGLLAAPPGELWISDCLIEETPQGTQREGPVFHIRGGLNFWSLSAQLGPGPWKIAFRDTKSPVAPANPAGLPTPRGA